MKICYNCGAQVDDNAQFCKYCGARFDEEVTDEKDYKWWYIGGAALAALLILIVAGYFVLGKDSKPDGNEPSLPEIQKTDSIVEGGPNVVTGYRIESRDDEQMLVAEFGTLTKETGESMMGLQLIGIADFDGDGNKDALVLNGMPGSSGIYSYSIVYYDSVSETFKSTYDTIETFSDSPEIDQWKDRSTVVVRDGLHMERYALENGQLKKVEDKTADVGKRIHAITTESLFSNSSGDYEERETMFDVDGDGEYEILTFSHDTSHPYDFGAAMCLEKIRWSDGRETTDGVFSDLHGGSTFEFLEKKKNGVHDLLVSGRHLYHWNGTRYVE